MSSFTTDVPEESKGSGYTAEELDQLGRVYIPGYKDRPRPLTDADWQELWELAETTLADEPDQGHVTFTRLAIAAGYRITRTRPPRNLDHAADGEILGDPE